MSKLYGQKGTNRQYKFTEPEILVRGNSLAEWTDIEGWDSIHITETSLISTIINLHFLPSIILIRSPQKDSLHLAYGVNHIPKVYKP
jgi:hypothetical protein